MSAGTAILQPQKHTFQQVEPNIVEKKNAAMFAQMDATQRAIDPYLEKIVPPTKSQIDPNLSQEALDTVNEIRKFYGEEPITNTSVARRLHGLLARIAQVVEQHLVYKKEKNHTEETKIKEETLPNLQSWTRWQGGAHGISGLGAPFLLLLAGISSKGLGEALRGIAQMTPQGANAADRLIGSWMMPDQYKQNLHLNTVQSKKQAEEGLKSLPQQVQQLLMKLLDQLQQMYRSTGQRG
jgi:hypothetical protein